MYVCTCVYVCERPQEQLVAFRTRDAIYQDEMTALQKENSALQMQVNRLRGELQRVTIDAKEGDDARVGGV